MSTVNKMLIYFVPTIALIGGLTEATSASHRSTKTTTFTPMAASGRPQHRQVNAYINAASKSLLLGKSFTKSLTLVLFVLNLSAMIHANDASTCKRTSHLPAHKPKIVLVHGFNSGAWYWFKVMNRLELAGYNVTALDLKASGIDRARISEVETFEDYNEPLDHFMSSLPEHERVVVVGHSAGGVSVTKTLIDHSEKVLAALYVAATMLKSGYLTCHHLRIGVPHFGQSRCSSSCPELPTATCFEKALPGAQGVPLADQPEYTTLMRMMARPGPYRAIVTTNFTKAVEKSLGVDKVARVYVKTLLDPTIVPEQQAAMIDLWPPCEVIATENDHDAPVANPDLIASIIINATMYDRV